MKKIRLECDVSDIEVKYGNVKVSLELVDEEIDEFNMMSQEQKEECFKNNGSFEFEAFSIERKDLKIVVDSVRSQRIYDEGEDIEETSVLDLI